MTVDVPAIGALKATPGDIEDLENGNYAVTTTNGISCYLSVVGPGGKGSGGLFAELGDRAL